MMIFKVCASLSHEKLVKPKKIICQVKNSYANIILMKLTRFGKDKYNSAKNIFNMKIKGCGNIRQIGESS